MAVNGVPSAHRAYLSVSLIVSFNMCVSLTFCFDDRYRNSHVTVNFNFIIIPGHVSWSSVAGLGKFSKLIQS